MLSFLFFGSIIDSFFFRHKKEKTKVNWMGQKGGRGREGGKRERKRKKDKRERRGGEGR